MRTAIFLIVLLLLCATHFWTFDKTYESKRRLDRLVRVDYVLPAEFSSIVSLDFKGLIADFQLLQAIFFIGEKIDKEERISISDWRCFKRIIKTVNELDPYFFDPYYLGASMLVWGPGMYEDAIELLEHARKYRSWDRRIPFQEGFIYFYFLKNYAKGSELFSLAARFPDAPAYYATLAARLAYYAGDHESSILLLKNMLSETGNKEIRKMYIKRLTALEGAIVLERAVADFKEKNGKLPQNLEELLASGLIDNVPIDPYGGKYLLTEGGRIFSTSKFAEMKK